MPVAGKDEKKEQMAEDKNVSLEKETDNREEEQAELPVKEIATGNLGHIAVESLGKEFMTCNAGKIGFRHTITHENSSYIPKEQAPYQPYTHPENLGKPDSRKLYEDIYSIVSDFL